MDRQPLRLLCGSPAETGTVVQYVNLGRSGLKVSRICLGCMTYGDPRWRPWVLPEADARPLLRSALDLGITFFDTADMYSLGVSEEITGRALKDFGQRQNLVVATKVYWPMGEDPNARGLSRKHIFDSIDASLRRLGMDYVDLYQIHRWDYRTPIGETLDALDDVVRSGRVRYIGASSMFAWQFMKALTLSDRQGWSRFVSMQNHYNLAYREEEREMLPLCQGEGIGVLPWSPLARGLLTGTRRAGEGGKPQGETDRARHDEFARKHYTDPSEYAVAEAVQAVAARHGRPPAQIALAWLLSKPAVTAPVIGASKPGQLEDAVAALEVALSPEDTAELEAPYRPHKVIGHE
jgi:aryl-alcohol dehydrogenase (NADP+)